MLKPLSIPFKQFNTQWMIHGHTHRPAIHTVDIDGKPHYRGVLGAWHTEGSMFKSHLR